MVNYPVYISRVRFAPKDDPLFATLPVWFATAVSYIPNWGAEAALVVILGGWIIPSD